MLKRFRWVDYGGEYRTFAESCLDAEAVRFTGCDDGWEPFYAYWKNAPEMELNRNFWCKVVFLREIPIALIAFTLYGGTLLIMELVVSPEQRGKGFGSGILTELLQNGNELIGSGIRRAEAVVFPENSASRKAFRNAGFVFSHVDPDGGARHYIYTV